MIADVQAIDALRKQCHITIRWRKDDANPLNLLKIARHHQTGGDTVMTDGGVIHIIHVVNRSDARVFQTADPAYADVLAESFVRTETALNNRLGNYGQMSSIRGFDIPAWLPSGETTIGGIALFGLSAYYNARLNDATADVLTKIAAYRLGDDSTYPFGIHAHGRGNVGRRIDSR